VNGNQEVSNINGKLFGCEISKEDIYELLYGYICDNLSEYDSTSEIDYVTKAAIREVNRLVNPVPRLSVFNIEVKLHKFKNCRVCGKMFYDTSRNGRQIVCKSRISHKYDEKLGSYENYRQRGKLIFDCERINENTRKTKNYQNNGSATSYSYLTRLRKEKELFTWTDFTDRKTDRLLARNAGYSINGKRKGFSVTYNIDGKGQGVKVKMKMPNPNGNDSEKFQLENISNFKGVFTINIKTGEKQIINQKLYEKYYAYK
jgi:hypothetical protein